MILIADSGSTKTYWSLIKADGTCSHYYTQGINPFFQTEYEIEGFLRMTLLPQLGINEISEIYFYGAGCATEKQINLVQSAFSKVFVYEKIEVASDLLGAARALCGNEPGIACILGTGSNSCYYDGNVIAQQVSPLGFIIGDEGSGASLGKRLVADCLKNQLPEGLKERFLERFKLTQAQIVENIYSKPFPSRFLASLSLFLIENIEEPALYQIVYDGFADFFKRNVFQYDYKGKKVNVVGSIGYHYQDVLRKVAADLSLQLGKVIQAPSEELIKYHIQRSNKL
jgi:N-acetylglucosamine kinase-like BadF-type ATPase